MFFPASERWADNIITELARGSDLEDKYNFTVTPKDGIDTAMDILDKLTKSIQASALNMKHAPSEWPNGHLWHQSVEQVTKMSEGSRRVVARKSVLNDALRYSEALPAIPNPRQTKHAAARLRGQLESLITELELARPLFTQQDRTTSNRSPLAA